MIDYPDFFVANVADYIDFFADAKTFLQTHPREATILHATSSQSISSPLAKQYFSMVPYLLGPGRAIKFSARPCDGQAPDPAGELSSNYLSEAMARYLGHQDACFDFLVQVQTDALAMPIEDPTVDWSQDASPFVKVATLRIPSQTFTDPDQTEFCDNLSFTPWHALATERPLGGINRARRTVYETISKLRHDLNGAPRREPSPPLPPAQE
jgi:hypothetical protein